MNFMFSWQELYSSCHENIKFISSCHRVISSINTDFKQNSTPFVLSISQRSSEGWIGPPTHPDQVRVSQNTATLSQAGTPWLRLLSNIISHTLFQLSMNRVLCNRMLREKAGRENIGLKFRTCARSVRCGPKA